MSANFCACTVLWWVRLSANVGQIQYRRCVNSVALECLLHGVLTMCDGRPYVVRSRLLLPRVPASFPLGFVGPTIT